MVRQHNLFCFVLLFLLLPLFTYAQQPSSDREHALRFQFNKTFLASENSIVLKQRRTVDSLSHQLDELLRRQSLSLKSLTDSLLSSNKEVLTSEHVISIVQLHHRCSSKMNTQVQHQQKLLKDRFAKYQQTVSVLAVRYKPCTHCTTAADFHQSLQQFMEETEQKTEPFLDSLTEQFDNDASALTDSTDLSRDAITSYVESLTERRSAQLDSVELHSNKFIVSVDGRSHASYRGRDGGVSQSSLSPAVAIRLSSGLRFSLSAGWTDEPEFHRDGASAGMGYDFTILPILSASLGYSYLWFTDSSTQDQSVFHHSIDGSLSLETSIINFGAGIGISIGKESEYALNASFSRSLSFGNISVDPMVTISWGEQNGQLALTRIEKANSAKAHGSGKGIGKGNNSGTQQQTVTLISIPKNVFSIMSYEVILPVSLKLGRVLLVPSLTAVVPMNIIDGSRSLPYFNAGLSATVDWIW